MDEVRPFVGGAWETSIGYREPAKFYSVAFAERTFVKNVELAHLAIRESRSYYSNSRTLPGSDLALKPIAAPWARHRSNPEIREVFDPVNFRNHI
ncbi:MAG: hypothetical protein QF437_05465 [Planctomycetota bacterium]|nr:hypothetical protein [Planctomycetota bacterium]